MPSLHPLPATWTFSELLDKLAALREEDKVCNVDSTKFFLTSLGKSVTVASAYALGAALIRAPLFTCRSRRSLQRQTHSDTSQPVLVEEVGDDDSDDGDLHDNDESNGMDESNALPWVFTMLHHLIPASLAQSMVLEASSGSASSERERIHLHDISNLPADLLEFTEGVTTQAQRQRQSQVALLTAIVERMKPPETLFRSHVENVHYGTSKYVDCVA